MEVCEVLHSVFIMKQKEMHHGLRWPITSAGVTNKQKGIHIWFRKQNIRHLSVQESEESV